ncbi:MAG: ABC transporter permease [Chloroflexi bacterium]|nr:ABC transporter permease [Chloroflexota bacterium]
MTLLESLRSALSAILSRKLRSFLTVLGIVIGVAAVIALMSIGEGAQARVTSSLESIGTNLLFVRPGAPPQAGAQSFQPTAGRLTLADAAALTDPALTPAVVMAAPEVSTAVQAAVSGSTVATRAMGVTPEYETVRNFTVAEGRFISEADVEAGSLVTVVGSNVAEALFGELSPVGESIRLSQRRFRVVGVLESKGGTAFGSQDNLVVVPITTAQRRLTRTLTARGADQVQVIYVQARNASLVDAAKEQVTALLRELHDSPTVDDFTITTQQETLATLTQALGAFTIFLGAVAGISLVVGGIGIMNIMLVSVTERTREIGIRKAVGAKSRDILLQFLVESALLSLAGGLLGVALGAGASQLVSNINIGGTQVPAAVTPDIVLLAVGVATAIGLFFGFYPASRAARLDPIQALRSE